MLRHVVMHLVERDRSVAFDEGKDVVEHVVDG
jgi:hypothetical protein